VWLISDNKKGTHSRLHPFGGTGMPEDEYRMKRPRGTQLLTAFIFVKLPVSQKERLSQIAYILILTDLSITFSFYSFG